MKRIQQINFCGKGKVRLLTLAIYAVFLFGLIVGVKEIFPYQLIKQAHAMATQKETLSIKTTGASSIKGMSSCTLTELKSVPDGATAFIGHAYGSHSKANKDSFLAENVLSFIQKNSHSLDSIIFTGDVFRVPSLKKWIRLGELATNFSIHIAPGNHDVEGQKPREIFEQSQYGKMEYPRAIETTLGKGILEDSMSTQWAVSDKTINMLNTSNSDITIVARHHIPIRELIKFSNSRKGFGKNFDTLATLKNKVKSNKVIWIIGDGGAFRTLPRITCLSSANHTFIINGTGATKGDTVLLMKDGDLNSYIIE